MLFGSIALVALLVGLAAALYFKSRGRRSEQEKRAKRLSRFLAGDIAAGGTGASGSGGGHFDGDD